MNSELILLCYLDIWTLIFEFCIRKFETKLLTFIDLVKGLVCSLLYALNSASGQWSCGSEADICQIRVPVLSSSFFHSCFHLLVRFKYKNDFMKFRMVMVWIHFVCVMSCMQQSVLSEPATRSQHQYSSLEWLRLKAMFFILWIKNVQHRHDSSESCKVLSS